MQALVAVPPQPLSFKSSKNKANMRKIQLTLFNSKMMIYE